MRPTSADRPSAGGWLTDLIAKAKLVAVVDVFVANLPSVRPSAVHRSRKSHKAFCEVANSADISRGQLGRRTNEGLLLLVPVGKTCIFD